jgi:hypothetical protein
MNKKKFDVDKWLELPQKKSLIENEEHKKDRSNDDSNIEFIIQQIEGSKIDLTSDYSAWLNIGFALADKFGESGRNYYHRVSQFHPDYNATSCDVQYNNCLSGNRTGITIGTFYFLCKNAGIKLYTSEFKETKETEDLPILDNQAQLLSDTLFPQLPQFLQKITNVSSSKEERDLLLLGSMVTLSACFPKLYGIYDGNKVFANLFLFITAPASAGKGRLVHCKQLVNPIHKKKREESKLLRQKYEAELQDFNRNKGKDKNAVKPLPPPEKMLFIPANNSATGAFQLLNDNEGRGLIFETEGDTLSQAFKSDYGNYSDGFRKAFHHETISYYRRTDREFVEIEKPCISCLLSGTPKQISALIPNAENGLFSRFMFYYMNIKPSWKNVFEKKTENGLGEYFDELACEFHLFYEALLKQDIIKFELTEEQENRFNNSFEAIQNTYLAIQSMEYMATVRRLGVVTFRIAMIFTILRTFENGDTTSPLICDDVDFNNALDITKTLVKHASIVFSELPEDRPLSLKKNLKEQFLDKLPKFFNRQEYLEIAKDLDIADKTAEGYISKFIKGNLLFRLKKDHYEKIVQ